MNTMIRYLLYTLTFYDIEIDNSCIKSSSLILLASFEYISELIQMNFYGCSASTSPLCH